MGGHSDYGSQLGLQSYRINRSAVARIPTTPVSPGIVLDELFLFNSSGNALEQPQQQVQFIRFQGL